MATTRIVLLFCHGGSLNKGCWAPIVNRLQQSALLQRVPCEIAALDWRFHGERSTDDHTTTFYLENDDKSAPRVKHPANEWPEWAPAQLYEFAKTLKSEDDALGRTTHIVGIGHSMGGSALLTVETRHPGTFAGLVLFEPTLSFDDMIVGGAKWAMTLLVKTTLAREGEWKTMEEAVAYHKSSRAFRNWHPECLAAYLKGGVKKTNDGKGFRLAMPLMQEAALYCHELPCFPKDQAVGVKCRVAMEMGDRTAIFNAFGAYELAQTIPDKFHLGDPMPGKSHFLVMEDPDKCAQRIIANLALLPLFQRSSSRL